MKFLILFTLFILSGVMNPAYAVRSVEWQRIELESKIDNHYYQALSSILSPSEYQLKSKVEYSDPGMPQFDDLNRIGMKVSDVSFDDSLGDYIAFSKVGMEVPVIEKYYQENQNRLKELYRYNDSYNLFKNIESISLNVVFSDQLPEAKVNSAKKIIEANQFEVGDITTQVKYNVDAIMPVIPAVAGPEKPDGFNMKDFLDLLGRFGNAIGMFLTALLLCVSAYFLLKKYMELLKELHEQNTKPSDQLEAEEEKPDEDEAQEELENENQEDASSEEDGLYDAIDEGPHKQAEKILGFFKTHKEMSVLILKRWIGSNHEDFDLALNGLAQQLDHDMIKSLQEKLEKHEREKWSAAIKGYLTPEELQSANKIILGDVVREIVSGQQVNDMELVETLLSLEVNTARKFIETYPEEGGILLNVLSPNFTSKILEDIDESKVSTLISRGFSSVVPFDSEGLKKFKDMINEFKDQNKINPFGKKVVQILSEVDPDKEKVLYKFLKDNDQRKEIIEHAKKNIPSELVLDLPQPALKFVLQNYPLDKKVELMLSLSEDKRNDLLDSIAEEGSTNREMFEMELDTVRHDEVALKRIKKQSSKIWKDFVLFVRQSLSVNDDYLLDIEGLIEEWASTEAVSA